MREDGLVSACFLQMYLQITFLIISAKTEKNFLYFKLVSVASTIIKIKFQAINSFDITTIDSAYLNNNCWIIQALLVNYGQWPTCLRSDGPPISQCCPFKTAPHASRTDVPFSKLTLDSRWIFPEIIKLKTQQKTFYTSEDYILYTFCNNICEISR